MKKAILISSAIIGILSSAVLLVYIGISNPLCEVVSVINMLLLLLILMLTQQIGLRNSELAKINEDLKQSEEQYRLLFEAANDMVFIHHPVNNESRSDFIRVNQKASNVLGYSHEEFLTLSPLDIITEDSFDDVPEECEKLENQKHLLFEKTLVAKSGQKINVEINAKLFDFQGKTTVLSIVRDVTERKQAEKMLRASEIKYRTLFDNNSDGLLVADIRSRRFISANHKICGMFGYSEDELLCLGIENIHPEADLPFVINEFECLVKGEKRLSENIPCLRKDGSIFFAEISAAPLEIDGEFCVIGIFRDVSERRQAEERLRKNEETLSKVFRASPGGIAITTMPEGRFVEVNEAFLNLFGYSREELIGKTSSELHIWADADFRNHAVASVHIRKNDTVFEAAFRRKNKELFYALVSLTPIHIDGTDCILTIGIDITERRKAEEALKASEERYRTLVESIPGAVYRCELCDPWQIEHISAEAERITGYPIEAFIFAKIAWGNLIHPEDRKLVNRAVEDGIRFRRPYDMRYRIIRKDDSVRWVYEKGKAIYSETGEALWLEGVIVDISEHKKSEESLLRSEQEKSGLLRAAPVGIGFVANRVIGWSNKKLSDITGYSYEELYGMPARRLYPSDDEYDRVGRVKHEAIRKLGVGQLETVWVKKSGEARDILLASAAIDSENFDKGLVFTVLDITERKQADELLRESERVKSELIDKLNESQRIAMIGSWDWNIQTGKVWWSDETYRIFGVTPEEYTPSFQGNTRFIHPDDLKNYSEFFELSLKTGESLNYDVRIITMNNIVKNCYAKGRVVYDDSGQAIHFVGTISDITERKRAEESLKESENKYRSMYCAMSEGVALHEIIYDDTGIAIDYRITDVNPAYEKLTDIRKEDAVGSLASQLYRTDSPPYIEIYGKVAESGEPFHFETYFAPMKKHFSMSAYSPKKGTFVTIFSDITDRKTDEEERKKLESRLRQAQNMEALGTLAGGIAHDFNNILFPIMGYSEMTMDDLPEDSDAHNNLQEILKAAHRAKELVNQILTFSRQKEHEKNMIHIQPIVKETLKLIRATLPATIKLVQSIDSDCSPVMGDPVHIHQIVMNLCTNAYHAMQGGEGILEVTLSESELQTDDLSEYPDSLPGNYLRLSVSDTGVGIRSEILERIFDPFFTTKPVGKGTGLGLSVIHGIVKQMGGHIRVYSQQGQGSVFNVYLPAIIPEIAYTSDCSDIHDPIQMGIERILLVDDEEPILTMLHKMLEELGYKVSPRTSSVEAFKAFENRPDRFDLVITDMTMPNMTGAYLARKIIEIRKDIPIILCTGFSEHINAEKSKDLGIRGYLMKPVIRADMAKMIRKVLEEVGNEKGGIGL